MSNKTEINSQETKLDTISVSSINNKRSWIKSIVTLIIAISICLGITAVYKNNVVGNGKYAYKIGDIKITKEEYNYFFDELGGEDDVLFFIADTFILSDLAKKHDISVNKEEIDAVEYDYFKEELALAEKLQKLAYEKTNNVSEEELKQFYEDNKSLFVKEGTITFAAIQTDSLLPYDHVIKTDDLNLNEEKISELLENGFDARDLVVNTHVLVSANEDYTDCKYFYFTKKDETEYSSYEEVKETLQDEYDLSYGISALQLYVSKMEETITVEDY